MTTRRDVLAGLGVAATAPSVAFATSQDERLYLWPRIPPSAPSVLPSPITEYRSREPLVRWLRGIDRPWISIRRPSRPNGTAVLLIPGGGYGFLSWDREGEAPARWFNEHGTTAFILAYRLPGEGWHRRGTVALADAQRAVRLIREGARRFAIEPSRVSVAGFSAGGHLAASLAARHAETIYAPVDAADALSARPDVLGLLYPVVSMHAPFAHAGSREALLGPDASIEVMRQASVETRVMSDMPPTFMAHAADDGVVPWTNSLALFDALRIAARPAAMHVFENGGHGFGVHLPPGRQAAAWPGLFNAFLANHMNGAVKS